MKYYIITGEASGDLHASNLIKELIKRDENASFRGWGGDLMQEQGVELVRHYRDLAFMGFTEVVLNLNSIFQNIKFCKKDILSFNPDAIILVDYPGFNLRIAEFASKLHFKVVYYISPQVWAWKQSRVKKIRKYVDKMLVILPFEKEFYSKHHYAVEFVGHPLLDAIEPETNSFAMLMKDFRDKHFLDEKPIIALLPGSRKQEISAVLEIITSMVDKFTDYQFIIGGISSIDRSFYTSLLEGKDVKIIFDDTYSLLKLAYAAIVTSGTATLETALFGVPQVICFKGRFFSYQIAKRIVNVKFIGLVNLIMDRKIVAELIQNDLNEANLYKELKAIIEDKSKRKDIIRQYKMLHDKLGGAGASKRAAEEIVRTVA
ncbi:MAG: lipid-A-disaccharide synthase [Bacteroidales bacterium]|nr:lipid-A-disaccharide synthase [Bacteroidales bacterium]